MLSAFISLFSFPAVIILSSLGWHRVRERALGKEGGQGNGGIFLRVSPIRRGETIEVEDPEIKDLRGDWEDNLNGREGGRKINI